MFGTVIIDAYRKEEALEMADAIDDLCSPTDPQSQTRLKRLSSSSSTGLCTQEVCNIKQPAPHLLSS